MSKTQAKKLVHLSPKQIRLCIEGLTAVYHHDRMNPDHKDECRDLIRYLYERLPHMGWSQARKDAQRLVKLERAKWRAENKARLAAIQSAKS